MCNDTSAPPQLRCVSRLAAGSRLVALVRSALVAGTFAITPAAFAANADVTVSVTSIPANVSLGTFASYRVTIQNNTVNVINNVTFGGSTNTVTAEFLETVPAVVPGCTSGLNSIQCSLGQLRGAAEGPSSVASFDVLFKAPATGTSFNFVWVSTFSSGNSSTSPPANYESRGDTVTTGLTDSTTSESFTSAVPSGGGTFSTGFNSVPTASNVGTTKVYVPNRPVGDGTAKAVETFDTQGNVCAGGFSCVISTITIPGTFSAGHLEITLTRDAASIKPGLKIENTKIYYTPDGQDFSATDDVIGLCVGFGTKPLAPAVAARPCIADRTQFPNNYKPDPALSGDMRWLIYSRHNGLNRY